MFFQNAMGVQTLMVTHGDNAQSQHSQPQTCRRGWGAAGPPPSHAQHLGPSQALPSRPDRRRVLHALLPLRLPELPRFAPAKICRLGQEKDANSDANPAKDAPSIPAGLVAGWPLGILKRGRTGREAASALTSACVCRGCYAVACPQQHTLRQLLLWVHGLCFGSTLLPSFPRPAAG